MSPQPSAAHCHKKVKEVAQALAGATYENLMGSSNEIYLAWRQRFPGMGAKALERRFVARYWGDHIHAARTTLTLMLTSNIDEARKMEIEEVLILDSTLMRGRREPGQVLGTPMEQK